MGLRKNFDYDEVLRAIGQQPLDLPAPKRAGLKTYESILFSNLINDQSSYDGGAKKGGFSHEVPYEAPARPDVFFDARSDGAQTPFPSGDDEQPAQQRLRASTSTAPWGLPGFRKPVREPAWEPADAVGVLCDAVRTTTDAGAHPTQRGIQHPGRGGSEPSPRTPWNFPANGTEPS